MELTKYRLGDMIQQFSMKCGIPNLKPYQVSAVTKDKQFLEPSNQVGDDTSNYKVVPVNFFACNLMHVGRDVVLPVAFNNSGHDKYVSPAYTVFSVRDGCDVLDFYLFMLLQSSEMDRLFWFHADGSVRDGLSWTDFCDVEIDLPPLSIQQKYVAIYQAMVANQQSYERGLEDLKLVCDGYIEDLRRKIPCERIGSFVEQSKEKNIDGAITLEQGINIEKKFITPQRSNSNPLGRQIVRTGQISYCTQLNNANVAIALRTGPDCIVSAVYDVIYIKDESVLLPEYLMMWFSRSEFGRFVYWASQGTSYEFLSFENLAKYRIPVPDIHTQKSIVDIYNSFIRRKEINEHLKKQIKDICPILIRGSLLEEHQNEVF